MDQLTPGKQVQGVKGVSLAQPGGGRGQCGFERVTGDRRPLQ